MIGHTLDNTKANPRSFIINPNTSKLQINIPGIILNLLLYSFIDCRLVVVCSMQLCLTKAIWQMKVAIALEVPTEGKLCLSPPITPPLTGCISAQVLPVLHTQRRTIDVMLPDENCLFRAFTKALFPVQSGHITL